MIKKRTTIKAVKKSVKKRVIKKPVKARKRKIAKKTVNNIVEPTPAMNNICRSCNMLPVGSVELVSMLLVLVFALSAVLVTSVYALNQQSVKISSLQTQVDIQNVQN